MTHLEAYDKYVVKLMKCLPMDDTLFITKLSEQKLLPGITQNKIETLSTQADKASYFLNHIIKPALDIDDTSSFDRLLSVMQNCDYDHVENLSCKIKSEIDKQTDQTSAVVSERKKQKVYSINKDIEDTSLRNYKERFSEDDDVVSAFLYLLSKLEALWSESDFSQLQAVCQRDIRLPNELRSKLRNAADLQKTLDLLADSPFCTWLELRILKRMANVSDIPEATHMISTFEECVHNRKCADVKPYFKKEYINPDHLNKVIAKLNDNFEHLIVADLIKYCHNLECILQLPPESGAPANIKEGCLEIHFYIPTYSYLYAYESAKRNFLKLRPMHIQYLQIGIYPKVYTTSLCKTTEAQSLLAKLSSANNWSNPSQVIDHYYVYLKGHMDADSVSHMMHYKYLITDDDFKAITAAPTDDTINLALLQYVRSMDLSSLFKFVKILQNIETHKSIGHHLESSLKSTRNTDSPSLSTAYGINMVISVELKFLDLVNNLVMQMSTADVAVLVKQCGTMMASDVHNIPLFTPDFMSKLDNCTYPFIFKIYLLPFMSWFDHSILKELVESSNYKEALKLVNLFVTSIDYSKPIITYPIPEFSQLVIPLDSSEYTLLATKSIRSFNELTLQYLVSIKRSLVQGLEITSHAILLAGLHIVSYCIYWLIPNQIRTLVQDKLNQEQLELWNKGIVSTTILPVNFFSDNNLYTQENIFHVSLETSVEMCMMQHQVSVNRQELHDFMKQKQELKYSNLQLEYSNLQFEKKISIKENELSRMAEQRKKAVQKFQELKINNMSQTKQKDEAIQSLTLQLQQMKKWSTSGEDHTQDFKHHEKETALLAGSSKSSNVSGGNKHSSEINIHQLMNIVTFIQEKWSLIGTRLRISSDKLNDIWQAASEQQMPTESKNTYCCVKMLTNWYETSDDISADTIIMAVDAPHVGLKSKISSIEAVLTSEYVSMDTSEGTSAMMPPEKSEQPYFDMITKFCSELTKSQLSISDVVLYLKVCKINSNVIEQISDFPELVESLERHKLLNKTDLSWLKSIANHIHCIKANEVIEEYERLLMADKISWNGSHPQGIFLVGRTDKKPENVTIQDSSKAKSAASGLVNIKESDSVLNSSGVGSVTFYWKLVHNDVAIQLPKATDVSLIKECKNACLTHIGVMTDGNLTMVTVDEIGMYVNGIFIAS